MILLTSCSSVVPTLEQRLASARSLNKDANLSEENILTSTFTLYSLRSSSHRPVKTLHIYIEGDGLAWETRTKISNDPTPVDPIGMKLMLEDHSGNAVYLARPCQYIYSENCREHYWSNARYSEEIITSMDEAVSKIKKHYASEKIILIGYSGGGAAALLIASRRSDVQKVITIAGNLDHVYWTKLHLVTPLDSSLNPADYSQKLSHIPQFHMIGAEDTNVPLSVFKSYISHFQQPHNIQYKIYEKASHSKGWEKHWKKLVEIQNNL